MNIATTRAGLDTLAAGRVGPALVSLPERMAEVGVDRRSVTAAADAVSLAVDAQQARRRAQAAWEAATDEASQEAAWQTQTEADTLTDAARAAARHARAVLDARHAPVEAAIAHAGGPHRVAVVGWYDAH